jgi:hypothetical protein
MRGAYNYLKRLKDFCVGCVQNKQEMRQKELQIIPTRKIVKIQIKCSSGNNLRSLDLSSDYVLKKGFFYVFYLWYICCWRRKEEIFFAFLFELKEKYLSALLVRILYRENIFT